MAVSADSKCTKKLLRGEHVVAEDDLQNCVTYELFMEILCSDAQQPWRHIHLVQHNMALVTKEIYIYIYMCVIIHYAYIYIYILRTGLWLLQKGLNYNYRVN